MKLRVVEDYKALSRTAAAIIAAEITNDKRINISLTTGSTPVGTYQELIANYKDLCCSEHVHYYNFDELESVDGVDGYTIGNLRKLFFNDANVREDAIHKLTLDNYTSYDAMIENDGGLDIMLIGMGADGHFCGNMPVATKFDRGTYAIEILSDQPWIKTFQRIYDGKKIPTHFVTMGAQSLYKVRKLVLIISGKDKAKALKQFMESEITEVFPASVLKHHPNLIVIADREAASSL